MKLRSRQKFDKYRIEKRLGEGGFATVYRAFDTIEGKRVALKVPHADMLERYYDDFLREVRLAARLEHPNIVSLRFAGRLSGRFVIVSPLGERTLEERLKRRLAPRVALRFAGQLLEAVAYAHGESVMHCDIKPDNLLVFDDGALRLTDFGIAKIAARTVHASGSGTIGYVAPEQAMGRPSFRSDVFSSGLVIYRMFAGRLPEWPFTWPPAGYETLRSRWHADTIAWLRRALELDPRKRFRDGGAMLNAFRRLEKRAVRGLRPRRRPAVKAKDWREERHKAFRRLYGKALDARHACSRCHGPVSEPMIACPWCGAKRGTHDGTTRFPRQCPRCLRGMKADWKYCAWCYGPGFEPSSREFPDARYSARCSNPRCTRKQQMPFMRYCPWCRTKVRRAWKVPGSTKSCGRCGWGVSAGYWTHCPWCAHALPRKGAH